MPGKGQIYKKPMKKKTMKRDPFAEGIDPSAGRGVPLSAYNEVVPKPKRKPQVSNTTKKGDRPLMRSLTKKPASKSQVSNTAAKGNKMAVKKKPMKKKSK